MKYTFDMFRHSSDLQRASLDKEPPDVQLGADAIIVAATLFDWIAVNVTDEIQRADIARRVAVALNLETT